MNKGDRVRIKPWLKGCHKTFKVALACEGIDVKGLADRSAIPLSMAHAPPITASSDEIYKKQKR